MLKNIEVKEVCKRWCNCHTCFVKLPVVTAFIVVAALFLSGCSPIMEKIIVNALVTEITGEEPIWNKNEKHGESTH